MKKIILVLICLIMFQSCANFKKEMSSKGTYDVAIRNAIIDFSNTSSLFNQDKYFVLLIDTLKDEKITVSISGTVNKIYYFRNTDNNELPNKCLEYKNKIFYWRDNNYPQDKKVVEKLYTYKLVDTVDSFAYTKNIIDDSKKSIHYYFCKNNFLIYKKVKTSIGIGYYKSPNLNCKK